MNHVYICTYWSSYQTDFPYMNQHVHINLKWPNSPVLYESGIRMYLLIQSYQTDLLYDVNHAFICMYVLKCTKQTCLTWIMLTYIRINLKWPNKPALYESHVCMSYNLKWRDRPAFIWLIQACVRINLKWPNRPALYESRVHMYVLI